MADQPETKDAILERFSAAREAFHAAIARFSDDALLAPREGEEWTRRDVLAHIAADHRWFTGQLTALAEGREPTVDECYVQVLPPGPDVDLATQEGRNAWQREMNRDRTLEQVRADLTAYEARLADLLEALPPEEFAKPYAIVDPVPPGRVRPAKEDEQGFPLWQWVRGQSWHHYEDHLRDFEG